LAVLVTGVGYIGAALAARLLRAGERVVGLDNGFATDLATVAQLAELGDFELVRGSVASPRAVARAFARGPFAVVYHLAAQASGYAAPQQPRYTETTNLTGPRVVLDAVVKHQVPRVVYGSSFRVYGPVLPPVVDEVTPYGPQGDLAHLSHVYGEKLLELYAGRHGLTAIAARVAVVYGLGPVMKHDYRYLTVPNKYCLQAVRGEPLIVYPGAATPTAFIHLEDAVAALQAAGAAPWPVGFHVANAAGEVCTVPRVAAWVAATAEARGLRPVVQPTGSAAPPIPPSARPVSQAEPRLTLMPIPTAGALVAGPPQDWGARGADTAAAQPLHYGEYGEPPVVSPQEWGAGGALPQVEVYSRLTACGWRPTRTLADSVGEMLDYFRARELT
jgi:UDP-glucuronate 4-epimerase